MAATTKDYRPDIDGLRAIAVLSVVAFHADVSLTPGGFVGVDVFFVLSGYLITRLILKDLIQGRFSIADFYDRRVRRILPALTAVYLFCFVVAAILFLPSEMATFARGLAASSGFVSNVLFFGEAGYFEAPSHTKPLLHTWCLSVEEQFYVFWPLLLALAYRIGKRALATWLTLAVILGSFIAAQFFLADSPEAVFYLLPYRAWELLVGAALPVLGARTLRLPAAARETMAAVGLAAVFYSIVMLTGADPFPGAAAIFPCVGTALVILAGEQRSTFVGRALSLRPLVLIGLISYSLYLWHWPLLAFARYQKAAPLSFTENAIAVGLSFVFALASWRYVERPFRRPDLALARNGRLFLAVAILALGVAVGLGVNATGGWKSRVSAEELALDVDSARNNFKICDADERKNGKCRVGTAGRLKVDALLFGDSHAGSWLPGFDLFLKERGWSGVAVMAPGCLLLYDVYRIAKKHIRKCGNLVQVMKRTLAKHPNAKVVFFANRWGLYTNGNRIPGEGRGGKQILLTPHAEIPEVLPTLEESNKLLAASLENTISALLKGRRKVVLMGQVPFNIENPIRCLRKAIRHKESIDECNVPTAGVMKRLNTSNMLLERLSKHKNVLALFTHEITCSGEQCSPVLEGVPLYQDKTHLSGVGAKLLIRKLWDNPETGMQELFSSIPEGKAKSKTVK